MEVTSSVCSARGVQSQEPPACCGGWGQAGIRVPTGYTVKGAPQGFVEGVAYFQGLEQHVRKN